MGGTPVSSGPPGLVPGAGSVVDDVFVGADADMGTAGLELNDPEPDEIAASKGPELLLLVTMR